MCASNNLRLFERVIAFVCFLLCAYKREGEGWKEFCVVHVCVLACIRVHVCVHVCVHACVHNHCVRDCVRDCMCDACMFASACAGNCARIVHAAIVHVFISVYACVCSIYETACTCHDYVRAFAFACMRVCVCCARASVCVRVCVGVCMDTIPTFIHVMPEIVQYDISVVSELPPERNPLASLGY